MFDVLKRKSEEQIQTRLPEALERALSDAGFIGVIVCAPKAAGEARLIDAMKVTELVKESNQASETAMAIARTMFADGDLAHSSGSEELGNVASTLFEDGFAAAVYAEHLARQVKRLKLPAGTVRVSRNGEDIFLHHGDEVFNLGSEESGEILEKVRKLRRGTTPEQLWTAITTA